MTAWLTGTLLATSVLVLIVLIVREPVRRYFGSRVAYGLWLIPAARLFMPSITTTVYREIPSVVSPVRLVHTAMPEALLLTSVAQPTPTLFEQVGGWTGVGLAVWSVGAIALMASRLFAYAKARRAILGEAVQLADIGGIRLVRSPEVSGPVAFGLFNRVIAVPTDFDRRFGARERLLALDHELSHHRSGDLFANTFAFVLLCLQWFNPLAWVAHAAFRFDQEAACDARVLDKAKADDRADYGRAIAKAASGRGLLFLAALDHRSSLQRRLESMLTPSTSSRRNAGRIMLATAVVIALPLTATSAIAYIDQSAPVAPTAPEAPLPPEPPEAPNAPLPPEPPTPPEPPQIAMTHHGDGKVWMKGKPMDFDKMTPEQRNEMRRELSEARAEIARERGNVAQEIAKAREEVMRETANGPNMSEVRAEIAKAMAEVDANAAQIRKAGQDPEQMKRIIRASLERVSEIDVEKIKREALAGIDEKAIEESISAAEKSIAEMEAQLDRADRH